VVDQLARGLAAAGHEVVLAAHPDSTCPAELLPLDPPGCGDLGSLEDEIAFSVAARVALAKAGVDLIHDHTTGLSSGPAPEVPAVLTMHGPCDQRLRPRYARAATRASVVAISRSQARLARGVPVARVIHHGVDPSAFPVGDGSGGYLLHLGRMSPDKGIDTAVRVARRAGIPLVIASKMREPAEQEYFETVIRPLLGQGVTFVGEVRGAEKLELLGRARALLNPVRWDEPFGMVMIEALACGTPVVATPRGAAPEIVDAAVGRIAADEDGLVAAVGHVDRIDRAACRARVERHFSSGRMVRDHLALYGYLRSRPAEPVLAATG
jgi:glycosyltransferase involved in cell wall biosynthesis